MSGHTLDIIPAETAKTLYGLFRERVARTPENSAYRYFDRTENRWKELTWKDMAIHTGQWGKGPDC